MFGRTIICHVFDDGTVIVQDQGGFIPRKDTLQQLKTKIHSLCRLTEEQIEFENWKREKEYEEDHKRTNEATYQRKIKDKNDPMGSVYLMKDTLRGCYKIGFSANLKSRIDQLKTANAGIEYLRHYEGAMSDEKHLHTTFERVKVSGEWFSLTDVHLAEIEQYFSSKSS